MAEPDYKALFENWPGMFLVLDPNLRIVAASNAYLQATLTDRANILGRFLFDAFPENPGDPSADTLRDTRASLDRVLANRVPDSILALRHEIRRPDREGGGFAVRYWSQTNSPILNTDGSVAHIVHRIEDVTEFAQLKDRGQATGTPVPGADAVQQATNEPPAQSGPVSIPVPRDVAAPHVLIVEDHPGMSAFLVQSLGRDYWVSRAFDGQEAVRKALLPDRPDLIIADIEMSGDAMVDELRRHETLADVPIVMLTAKADEGLRLRLLRHGVRDYLQKPFPVEELHLRAQMLLADRKRMKLLRESEERYRTLFNSIDEGFCIVRMLFDESDKAIDYCFIETNASFELQSGLFDVQGKCMRDLVPDMEDEWFETYGKVALTGEPSRFELRSDHLQRWFDAYAFRYGPPERRQVAILFNDITARRQSEDAMREADRRKDQFLALLAHELRNPLAPIRNAVQILRLSPAAQGSPTSQLLPMMERQLAHMARLLDDLLDVSRIANGKIELRKESVDIAQAVQAALEANKPLIEAMGQEVAVSLPPRPVVLVADPVRLAQIVSNLLNNAANYSKSGGRIGLTVQRQEDSLVRLSVKDSGVGISAKDLDKVFGLFVQVGSPFARPRSGLGIGLALVRTLVEMHGGRVEARSEGPGKGSEFIVWLPALARRDEAQPRTFTAAGSGA
jgi:signal transduction histidine kinase